MRHKDDKALFVSPQTGNEMIDRLLANGGYTVDEIGMSGSFVLIFDDKVLKIQQCGEEAENEYCMMKYLQGKLPVPSIYAHEILDGKSYLLMSKCAGQMSCSDSYMDHPSVLCRLQADGLKKLWRIDISGCPADQRLPHKLAQAKYNVEHGLVDMDNVQPDTFGENGFRDPQELLQWLYGHMPEEDLVLSHGDYCLPNLFGIGGEVTGYIDLGKTGIADRWCDIAICYRSLSDNYSGKYGGHAHSGYDEGLLFRELGIEPDWEKIRYYILLDELF